MHVSIAGMLLLLLKPRNEREKECPSSQVEAAVF